MIFTPLLFRSVSLHNCPVHKDSHSPITIYSFKIEEGQEWYIKLIPILLLLIL